MDKKDEIIARQLDLIRQMTERNLHTIGSDIWGTANRLNGTDRTPSWDGLSPVTPVTPGAADTAAPELPKTASATSTGVPGKKNEEEVPPPESMEDLKAELNSYIGLDAVKEEVRNLINQATVFQMRKEHELPVADMSLHMVFSGNPGTGKTMIARFMSRVYHSLGILSKGHLVEVERSGLVAGYVGQTAIKTMRVCEKAKGGVLFIDEAYSLTSKSENDFGFEAVDTVLKFMEDNRDDLVVIVAGYTELMEQFIDSNPGLQSRFNKYVYFQDYDAEEMLGIFKLQCKKNWYNLDEDAEQAVKDYLTMASEDPSEFGNARGVRNVFEKILTAQANRLAEMDDVTREQLMQITKNDVLIAAYGKHAVEEPEKKDEAPSDGEKAPEASS